MTLKDIIGWGPWTWIIVGLLLAAAETLAPGAFLIWLGIAAVATGVVELIHPLSFTLDFVVFAIMVLLFGLIGRLVYGARARSEDQFKLNRRMEALFGQEFVLTEAIQNGTGRIRVGDSVWRVTGPDQPAGAKVRVTGATEGLQLRVEKV